LAPDHVVDIEVLSIVIQFEHVSKRYKAQSAPALDDISLEIAEGEFTFLVGPSGSGKSTFLRLLLREEKATSGEVIVNGKDIAKMRSWKVPAFRRGMGAVFQDFRLLPEKTVTQNVAFALEVIGAPKSAVGPAVADALELVGLTEMADRKPGQLSGGEQQRVALARAFVNKPPILIADEPTGNLDPATSLGIMRLLDRINRTGTTVIMATHDAAIVDQMRKRVIELVGGHIIRDEARGVYGYAG
jgi:cell division transport system ATP-binding protein